MSDHPAGQFAASAARDSARRRRGGPRGVSGRGARRGCAGPVSASALTLIGR